MTLANILEEIAEQEYALPKAAPKHFFSFKHRRAMNKMLYPDNLPKAEKKPAFKRRMVIFAAVALLAVVTGAASIVRHGGFWFRPASSAGENYFEMFAENADKAPQTIENICYNINVPDRYKFLDGLSHEVEDNVVMSYYDSETIYKEDSHPLVRVVQMTKKSFVATVTPETDTVEAIEIKGFKGYSYTHKVEGFEYNSVLWDCGDYIHLVDGTVSMEEILEIAEGLIEK